MRAPLLGYLNREQPKRRSQPFVSRLSSMTALLVLGQLMLTPIPASAEGPCGTPAYSGDSTRIGNLIFLDGDGDGIFEPSQDELGLEDVTVQLWSDVDGDGSFEPTGDDSNGLTCTTTTDSNGHYWFHDVASGMYFVAASSGVPDSLRSSAGANTSVTEDNVDDGETAGSYAGVTGVLKIDGGVDQPTRENAPGGEAGQDETEANSATGQTPDPRSNLTIDMGFTTLSGPCMGIGNRLWLDLDSSGTINDGEAGIGGAKVELFKSDANGNPIGDPIATTETSESGYYLFPCVDPGTYVVVVPGENFADDGVLQGLRSTTDEPAGDNGDNGRDPSLPGEDVISEPVVMVDAQAPTGEPDKPTGLGLDFDTPADNEVNTEIDFGFTGLTIGNRVWLDNVTANGIQDEGEPGVAGVRVELWVSDQGSVVGDSPIAATVTDSNGYYLFEGLAPGSYIVRIPTGNFTEDAPLFNHISTDGNGVAPDADDDPTDRDDNGDGGPAGPVDSLPISLVPAGEPTGESDTASDRDSLPADANSNITIDFGFLDTLGPSAASLGDKVWVDANKNGIQDPDEEPISGVTLVLYDADGNEVARTDTDENGMYNFDGLIPGTYTVCLDTESLPDGMTLTEDHVGDDAAADSNGNPDDGCSEAVTLEPGEHNPSIDFGVYTAGVDLQLEKSGTYSSGKVAWALTITNVGDDAEPGPVVITDPLPNEATFLSATGVGAVCVYADQSHTVTCTFADGLEAGASLEVALVTEMKSSADCSVTNTAAVAGNEVDSDPSNNDASAQVDTNCGVPGNGKLPVTGASATIMALSALALGFGGWRLMGLSGRIREIRLRNRLDP